MLAQMTTFPDWKSDGYNPVLFFIVIQSGLVGVLIVLAFGQLMPELLAAEYPLKFTNLFPCYSIVYISLVFDWIGVGHCAWAFYYIVRRFTFSTAQDSTQEHGHGNTVEKTAVIRVKSAELMHKTGSPYGSPRQNPVFANAKK